MTSCCFSQNSSYVSSGYDSIVNTTSSTDFSSTLVLPDDIKFPKQLWNTTYYFSKNQDPNFCIMAEFGIPVDRYSSSVIITEFPGFEHNFEHYYYGSFSYEGDNLHFSFTNAKNEDTIKFTWNGKDIILDYVYSDDYDWEVPAIGVKVEPKK